MPEKRNITAAHSDEMRDIIGRVPSRVVLYGTTVIALLLVVLLAGAWFVRYPDIISAPVVISSMNTPVQQYSIVARVPVSGARKVRPGQRVLIRLQEYPYEEFGTLRGHVEKIADFALDSVYIVQIILDKGLQTTRNQVIEKRPVLTGTADIVTSEKNIIHRIFNF